MPVDSLQGISVWTGLYTARGNSATLAGGERQRVTDGRMQFTTVYERGLSVFLSWVTFLRVGARVLAAWWRRVTEEERKPRGGQSGRKTGVEGVVGREKGITGNEFSRVHAWLLELLFSPSFLLGSPPERISRSSTSPPLSLSLSLTPPRSLVSSTPFFDPQESINQRSSGAPCYRHDERWKYTEIERENERARAGGEGEGERSRDITEPGLGYVSPCRLTAATTSVTRCLSP